MVNYLYYKLYQASLRSSLGNIPGFLASVFLGGVISVNIIVISAFLAKIELLPFLFSNKQQGGGFTLILIVLTMIYYGKKRIRAIIKKYSQESNKQRIQGNIIVSIYIAISFLLIFAVAFFKSGKL